MQNIKVANLIPARPNNKSVTYNQHSYWRHAALGLILILLSACASQLKNLPKEAQVTLPKTWESEIRAENDSNQDPQAEPLQAEPLDVQNGWLANFDDDELSKHVATALLNNPDLIGSASQLKAAIEQVTISGANLWPSISANVQRNATDNEVSGVTTKIRTVSGTLNVGWEADIWGKLTQRKRSAAYSALAQGEIYKAAELSLVANVTRSWYNLVANKLQLDLAHQRLDSFKRTADLIDENYKRGLRSALDVYLSRTDVQTQISILADAKFNYIRSLRTFKTLLGEYPNTNLEFDANLPVLTNAVPAGLPAELLTRRPDLKASQMQYKSTIASAKAAHRDRFPSINFTGSIGDSRDHFNQLFDNDNMVMTLLSGITQPLFLAGSLKSRAQQAAYQAETAYASLVRTTLTAFEEVENGLSQEKLLTEQYTATKKAVDFAQGGLDLALDRYQSGIENYTTVLESQRRLFSSKSNEINIRNALLQNRVSLHLALGGDFSEIEDRDPLQNLPEINKD